MSKSYLYSNVSDSSCTGGQWIYQNGELYHYGRKGMKWGENIYGGYDNPLSLTYDPNYGLVRNIKNNVSNVYNYAKGYGKHVANNIAKETSARRGFARNYKEFYNYKQGQEFFDTKKTHIEAAMEKQIRDGRAVYGQVVENPSLMNKLNLAVQNAQYDVLSGLNSFLKKTGLDDEVDAIISIFAGNSGARKWDRGYETAVRRANPGYIGAGTADDYTAARRRGNPTGATTGPYTGMTRVYDPKQRQAAKERALNTRMKKDEAYTDKRTNPASYASYIYGEPGFANPSYTELYDPKKHPKGPGSYLLEKH